MAYKFCENHLAELYSAIKNNNISEIEKIEHELSSKEECVACSYIFKAKGKGKATLESFLAQEGFAVATTGTGNSSYLVFLLVTIAIFIFFTLLIIYILRK